MKRKCDLLCRLAILSAILSVSFSLCVQKHNILTQEEIAAGWTLLFDSETMNSWRDYNRTGNEITASWVVEDGTQCV